MMDFIYELYQNDNFVLYLTIILVILIVLFVLVLIFGKRDQKLEETKRLQKIDVDAFKNVDNNETKLEVVEEPKEEVTPEPQKEVKSIFDDTMVIPPLKENADSENINVTTFEPAKVETPEEVKEDINIPRKPLLGDEEENKPINIKELDEINFDDINLEKDLGELESIKKEFDSIEVPNVQEKAEVKKTEEKESKVYKAGPQIFSSVFVNKDNKEKEETKEEIKEEAPKAVEEKPKANLFTIEDDEEIELPALKKEVKKEEVKTFSFDDINGETYDIK